MHEVLAQAFLFPQNSKAKMENVKVPEALLEATPAAVSQMEPVL